MTKTKASKTLNLTFSVGGGGGPGIAAQQKIASLADRLVKATHFNLAECKALIYLHHSLEMAGGRMMKMRMREVLHVIFEITDEIMIELAFKAFDRDNDGHVDEWEWVWGLSTMIRGTTDELADWCYYIYDINGDGGLAREELSHCLKGCIYPNFGLDADELEECERDIVEIAMKKLDVDNDGQISIGDFKKAVRKDPSLLVAVGPCLPPMSGCAVFLSLITENYRHYTGPCGRTYKKPAPRVRQSGVGPGVLSKISAAPSQIDISDKSPSPSMVAVHSTMKIHQ